jgi:hypothetical protein
LFSELFGGLFARWMKGFIHGSKRARHCRVPLSAGLALPKRWGDQCR